MFSPVRCVFRSFCLFFSPQVAVQTQQSIMRTLTQSIEAKIAALAAQQSELQQTLESRAAERELGTTRFVFLFKRLSS